MTQLIKETLYKDWGQFFCDYEVIHEKQSEEQHVLLINTKSYGKVLLLDGVVQVTEKDNFIYHEMLTHVPILSHGNCNNILIIGGGDGGMLKEVLKYPNVTVTLVEIDESVITFSKNYLPEICGNAFNDRRTNIEIEDGAKFVAHTKQQFDVIIVDSTDPIGPGEVLFTKEFYSKCKAALSKNGILVTQNGIPFTQGPELYNSVKYFNELFNVGTCYLGTVPIYIGGEMAFGFATDNQDVLDIDLDTLKKRFTCADITTRYYNPEIHKASFVLPNYIEDTIKGVFSGH